MTEQVYDCYYDTIGNYHWTGVCSGEHIERGGRMSSVRDVREVVRGEWILLDGHRCSRCNHKLQTTGLPSFCPNCGADMRKGEANDN